MLMSLQSIVVHCSDLQRSIAFYRDRLGFPVKRHSSDRAEFHCGPVTLVLRLANSAMNPQQPAAAKQLADPAPGQAQFSFEVLNLEAFYSEMKEKGVEFARPPTPPSSPPSSLPSCNDFGGRLAVMLDPDCLPIVVTEAIR